MGLNDEGEKLRQAREWLATRRPGSQEWEAAWEHVKWVLRETPDPGIRAQAQVIADQVIMAGMLNLPAYE